MSQVTLYFPKDVEALVRKRASEADKSLSAFVVGLLTREVVPSSWPSDFVELLSSPGGEFEIPEDEPAEKLDQFL